MAGVFVMILKGMLLLISVLMTFMILLQEGKGGGLVGLGGTKAAGVEGVTNPIRRFTGYLAGGWFLIAIVLGVMARETVLDTDKNPGLYDKEPAVVVGPETKGEKGEQADAPADPAEKAPADKATPPASEKKDAETKDGEKKDGEAAPAAEKKDAEAKVEGEGEKAEPKDGVAAPAAEKKDAENKAGEDAETKEAPAAEKDEASKAKTAPETPAPAAEPKAEAPEAKPADKKEATPPAAE